MDRVAAITANNMLAQACHAAGGSEVRFDRLVEQAPEAHRVALDRRMAVARRAMNRNFLMTVPGIVAMAAGFALVVRALA